MLAFFKYHLIHSSASCVYRYRFASKIYILNKILGRYLFSLLQKNYGVYIHPEAKIGNGLVFPHPINIVIGKGVVIGDNVTIYQGVTLGGARVGDYKVNNYPYIEGGCVIFSGAVIVGNIRLGRGVVVGTNSVVNKSFQSFSTVVGAPARLIKSN